MFPETFAGNLGKRQFLSTGVAELVENEGPLHGKRLQETNTNTEKNKAERQSETNS